MAVDARKDRPVTRLKSTRTIDTMTADELLAEYTALRDGIRTADATVADIQRLNAVVEAMLVLRHTPTPSAATPAPRDMTYAALLRITDPVQTDRRRRV